jgi:hypothetical protein
MLRVDLGSWPGFDPPFLTCASPRRRALGYSPDPMRVVTVNQPSVFPRIYLFDRAAVADRYIYLGSAQFARRSTEQAVMALCDGLLRIPVEHTGRCTIDDTRFTADERWVRKSLARIRHSYGKLPGYAQWSDYVADILGRCAGGATVGELGKDTFALGLEVFGIDVETLDDAAICDPITGSPSGWMQELTRLSGGELYYCGGVAMNAYFDFDDWNRSGIRYEAQDWKPPSYAEDVPANLSMLDVLFRGEEAIAMMKEDFRSARARMEAAWQ